MGGGGIAVGGLNFCVRGTLPPGTLAGGISHKKGGNNNDHRTNRGVAVDKCCAYIYIYRLRQLYYNRLSHNLGKL